jgi:hypothetical protein
MKGLFVAGRGTPGTPAADEKVTDLIRIASLLLGSQAV